MSRCCLAPSFGFITDPLLTALSPDFDPAWGLAPHPRWLGLRAQRHTADSTVHTHTLVFTARIEALPITVDHTIVLTAWSHHIWQRGTTRVTYYRDMQGNTWNLYYRNIFAFVTQIVMRVNTLQIWDNVGQITLWFDTLCCSLSSDQLNEINYYQFMKPVTETFSISCCSKNSVS